MAAMARSSPAEWLALEEALLDFCEESELPGFLHFWESPAHFVVLGYSRKLEEEVEPRACDALGIPVLRRASGGGTVLQGPGCINYTLVLPIESRPEFASITSTNKTVMEKHRGALEALLGQEVQVQGHTDLTLQDRKFCGNAQRRKRRCFLFHGSFLVRADFALMEKVLRPPPEQPVYRAQRSHTEFLTNVAVSREGLEEALRSCWPEAGNPADAPDRVGLERRIEELVATKYGLASWNGKF